MQSAKIITLPSQHGASSSFKQPNPAMRLLTARRHPQTQHHHGLRRVTVWAEGGQQQQQGSPPPFGSQGSGSPEASSPFQWAKIGQALKKTVVPQVMSEVPSHSAHAEGNGCNEPLIPFRNNRFVWQLHTCIPA